MIQGRSVLDNQLETKVSKGDRAARPGPLFLLLLRRSRNLKSVLVDEADVVEATDCESVKSRFESGRSPQNFPSVDGTHIENFIRRKHARGQSREDSRSPRVRKDSARADAYRSVSKYPRRERYIPRGKPSERWVSGLNHAPAKRTGYTMAPRVRISLSPPKQQGIESFENISRSDSFQRKQRRVKVRLPTVRWRSPKPQIPVQVRAVLPSSSQSIERKTHTSR